MSEPLKINIRPGVAIIGLFKNLGYNFKIAFSEFIDNSTQSFFNHESELKSIDQDKVTVRIKPYTDKIIIQDDAFGMNLEEFKRAVTPASKPPDGSGRNQYGIGLKQAACWFGNKWSIKTTRYGSSEEYSTTIDVDEIVNNNVEEVEVETKKVSVESHYTIIEIVNLNHTPKTRAVGALTEDLSERYILDINNDKLRLIYKDKELTANLPKVYKETLEDGTTKEWKQDIAFSIETRIGTLHIDGFVQLLEESGTLNKGFMLLRDRRVIQTVKCRKIFGAATTRVSQRLYGLLNLDNWPVTEKKDKFIWDDELQEEFIEGINPLLSEIIAAANKPKNSKKDIPKSDDAKKTGDIPKSDDAKKTGDIPKSDDAEDKKIKSKEIKGQIEFYGKTYDYCVIEENKNANDIFIDHTLKNGIHKILINLEVPGINLYKNDEKCVEIIKKIAICLAISEDASTSISNDNGSIEPTQIRDLVNQIIISGKI